LLQLANFCLTGQTDGGSEEKPSIKPFPDKLFKNKKIKNIDYEPQVTKPTSKEILCIVTSRVSI
jgi:hypothetical protein